MAKPNGLGGWDLADDDVQEVKAASCLAEPLGGVNAEHEAIRRLLRGTGHEVDELDDMLVYGGYTLDDAVTAALAAQDRLTEVIAAAENRSLRAEWTLREAGLPIRGERDGIWQSCSPDFLASVTNGACGWLPLRPGPSNEGHEHWTPRPAAVQGPQGGETTSGGVEVTDALIERLAEQAERGYDLGALRWPRD